MNASRWGHLFLISLVLPAHPGLAGNNAGAYLQLLEGARPIGMGGAFVAVADDVNTLYFNPAGISGIPHREATFTHIEGLGFDRNANFLALTIPNRAGQSAWGLTYNRFSVDGIPETRLGANGLPVTDAAGNVVVFSLFDDIEENGTVSYSWKQTDKLRLGVTGRVLHQQIFHRGATGMGMDAGLLWQPTDDVRVGVSLRDMFESVKGTGFNGDNVPLRAAVGAAVRGWQSVIYSLQVESIEGEDIVVKAGAEKWWAGHYAARAGYHDGDFAIGGSAKFQSFQVDVAQVFNDDDNIDDTHTRMSGTYRF